MGLQVKNCLTGRGGGRFWRRRFLVLTLGVGIVIGSIVSGKVSAMKTMSFAGTNATPAGNPGSDSVSNSFATIRNACRAGGGQYRDHAKFIERKPSAKSGVRRKGRGNDQGRSHAGFL